MTESEQKLLESIIDKYFNFALDRVRRKTDAWLALAWNLFLASGGREVAAYENIKKALPAECTFEKVRFDQFLTGEEIFCLTLHAKDAIDICCRRCTERPFVLREYDHDNWLIAKLMAEMAEQKPDDTTFLPFCGTGNVAVNLPYGFESGMATELDRYTWALAYIRFHILEIKIGEFDHCDSFYQIEHMVGKRQFSLIIMNHLTKRPGTPPRIGQQFSLYAQVLECLTDDGRLIMAMPAFVTNKLEFSDFRQELIARKCIMSVTYIPPSINVPYLICEPMCVMLLTKNTNEEIAMMDTSPYFINNRQANQTGEDAGVLSNTEAITKNVKIDDITTNILHPKYYISALPGNYEKTTHLIECLRSLTPQKAETSDLPLVTIDNLTSNYLDCDIRHDELPQTENEQEYVEYDLPPDNDILIISPSIPLKIGRIDQRENLTRIAAPASQKIWLFRPILYNVTINYLMCQLVGNIVAKQLEIYNPEGGIDDMNLKDFLKIEIPWPAWPQQYLSVIDDAKKKLKTAQDAAEKAKETQMIDLRLQKHTLLSKLKAFEMNWTKLVNLSKNAKDGILDLNGHVSNKFPDNYYEYMDSMSALLKKIMNGMITLTDTSHDFGQRKAMSPNELIRQYCSSKAHSDRYTLSTGGNVDESAMIDIPADAFYRVADNIVNNAVEHGFIDENREDYEVRFQAYATPTQVIINIANNGEPLSEQISEQEVFEMGKSSKMHINNHSGLGCFDARRILEMYGAQVELESDPKAIFTINYKLIFSKTNENWNGKDHQGIMDRG